MSAVTALACPAATADTLPDNSPVARQSGVATLVGAVVGAVPCLGSTRFLAFGDSLTLGEVTAPVQPNNQTSRMSASLLQIVPTAAYPWQLQMLFATRYAQQVIEVANYGVSGETASNGARRFPAVIESVNPEVVLLLEGANDLNALGTSGIATAAAAMESMAREARLHNSQVFLATLPPARPGGKNAISESTIQAYNSRLASIAVSEHAILVDLYGGMLAGVSAYIGTDGLHPTEEGYKKIANIFFSAIRADREVHARYAGVARSAPNLDGASSSSAAENRSIRAQRGRRSG